MKNILLSLMLCLQQPCWSQECDLPLRPLVTQAADGIQHTQVESYLTNRLRLLTSGAGASGGMENAQFALAFGYDVIDGKFRGFGPLATAKSVR